MRRQALYAAAKPGAASEPVRITILLPLPDAGDLDCSRSHTVMGSDPRDVTAVSQMDGYARGVAVHDPEPLPLGRKSPVGRLNPLDRIRQRVRRIARFVYQLLTEPP